MIPSLDWKISREDFADLLAFLNRGYQEGQNISEQIRSHPVFGKLPAKALSSLAIEISYDYQSGSYVDLVRKTPEIQDIWIRQLASHISAVLPSGGSVLEVGVGEATTLVGVTKELKIASERVFGFDLSWSRLQSGKRWMSETETDATLFVADLFSIPMQDDAVDVVYSSHSLEPNRGHEVEMIAECLRVSRSTVVLFEPIYELASTEARARMDRHGYVTGLVEAASEAGGIVRSRQMLEFSKNPLNPTGVVIIDKKKKSPKAPAQHPKNFNGFACPLTLSPLEAGEDFYFAPEFGILYPVVQGIPLLASKHAVLASSLRGGMT